MQYFDRVKSMFAEEQVLIKSETKCAANVSPRKPKKDKTQNWQKKCVILFTNILIFLGVFLGY